MAIISKENAKKVGKKVVHKSQYSKLTIDFMKTTNTRNMPIKIKRHETERAKFQTNLLTIDKSKVEERHLNMMEEALTKRNDLKNIQ